MFIKRTTDRFRHTVSIPYLNYKIINGSTQKAEQKKKVPHGTSWWFPLAMLEECAQVGRCVAVDCLISHLTPKSPGIPVLAAIATAVWDLGVHEPSKMADGCLQFIHYWVMV